MTIDIDKLQEVASYARYFADSIQSIVTGFVKQYVDRKAAGEKEEAILAEPISVVLEGKESGAKAPDAAPATSAPAAVSVPASVSLPPVPVTPSQLPTNPSSQPSSQPTAMTIGELRDYVAGRTTPENRSQIRAALQKFGVKKLTELAEKDYAAFKDEVDKI